MEYKFTEQNFNEEVLQADLPVLIDFYADWCGPCKMMGPYVTAMEPLYQGKVKIGMTIRSWRRSTASPASLLSSALKTARWFSPEWEP